MELDSILSSVDWKMRCEDSSANSLDIILKADLRVSVKSL